jgi:hypothetical protein
MKEKYLKLNEQHRKYFEAITLHGIIVFQHVLQILVDIEEYEMAQLAKEALEGYCATYDMEVPKQITDIEDYKLEFWRFGLSGEIAAQNLNRYVSDCFNLITKK